MLFLLRRREGPTSRQIRNSRKIAIPPGQIKLSFFVFAFSTTSILVKPLEQGVQHFSGDKPNTGVYHSNAQAT